MMPLGSTINKLLNLMIKYSQDCYLCTPRDIMSERILSGARRRVMRKILSSKSGPKDYYKGR